MAKQKATAQTEPKEIPVVDPDSLLTAKEDVPASVKEILKVYPQYQTLYVDTHGGVFSTDTPEAIRGNAKLYENPFYHS